MNKNIFIKRFLKNHTWFEIHLKLLTIWLNRVVFLKHIQRIWKNLKVKMILKYFENNKYLKRNGYPSSYRSLNQHIVSKSNASYSPLAWYLIFHLKYLNYNSIHLIIHSNYYSNLIFLLYLLFLHQSTFTRKIVFISLIYQPTFPSSNCSSSSHPAQPTPTQSTQHNHTKNNQPHIINPTQSTAIQSTPT